MWVADLMLVRSIWRKFIFGWSKGHIFWAIGLRFTRGSTPGGSGNLTPREFAEILANTDDNYNRLFLRATGTENGWGSRKNQKQAIDPFGIGFHFSNKVWNKPEAKWRIFSQSISGQIKKIRIVWHIEIKIDRIISSSPKITCGCR